MSGKSGPGARGSQQRLCGSRSGAHQNGVIRPRPPYDLYGVIHQRIAHLHGIERSSQSGEIRLSQAGGFHDFANKKNIKILRIHPGGKPENFKFNYNEVISGKNLKQNILLEPGDQIIVK